jgi:hypothetical protein
MEWKPVVRGKPEVLPHPRDAALFQVVVQLSDMPPREWADLFAYPTGRVSLHEGLRLTGATITIAAEEGREAEAVKAIDERLALANTQYAREVLPGIRAQEERQDGEAAEQQRRMEEARDRLKNL